MRHLVIEQNSGVEVVSNKVVPELYNIAQSIEDDINLSGSLLVAQSHPSKVEYLTNRFQNLTINTTGESYIDFKDPLVEQILLGNNIGDGIGITTNQAKNTSSWENTLFAGTDITSFDELPLFKNITNYTWNTSPWSDVLRGFAGCSKLISIDLQNHYTHSSDPENQSNATALFRNCTSLVTVKNLSLDSIARYMFDGCIQLQSIDLSSVTKIGECGFRNCSNLDVKANSLDFSKITYLGGHSFTGVPNIGDIELPSLNRLRRAFAECTSITSIKNLPNLTSIDGPNNSWQGIFHECENLDTIDLSLSTQITTIPRGIAENCTNLRILKLPSSVNEDLPMYTIHNCPNFQAVVINSENIPNFNSKWADNVNNTFKIYVPDNSVTNYQSKLTNYSSRIYSLSQFAIDFPND